MELIVLLGAEIDIQAAFNRYDAISSGRGLLFLKNLQAAFDFITRNPHAASKYDKRYRKWLLKDFPYGVFYDPQANRIVIAAIVDMRQNPRSIKRKLRQLGD